MAAEPGRASLDCTGSSGSMRPAWYYSHIAQETPSERVPLWRLAFVKAECIMHPLRRFGNTRPRRACLRERPCRR